MELISANNSGWGQIGLQAWYHPIEITVFRKSGGRTVEFRYMGPGVEDQTIPAEVLFMHADDPELFAAVYQKLAT